jgi:hypothetical protein
MKQEIKEWLNDRSNENLVLFYAEELKAIMKGTRPKSLLSSNSIKRLKAIPALIISGNKPAIITDLAKKILEDQP